MNRSTLTRASKNYVTISFCLGLTLVAYGFFQLIGVFNQQAGDQIFFFLCVGLGASFILSGTTMGLYLIFKGRAATGILVGLSVLVELYVCKILQNGSYYVKIIPRRYLSLAVVMSIIYFALPLLFTSRRLVRRDSSSMDS